jgi:hypothetical protein
LGQSWIAQSGVKGKLTPDDVGDVSEIPRLPDQIDGDIASMTADGAYGGEAAYDAVADCHPGAAGIIPPRATVVASGAATTQRDQHIATITNLGRMGWQPRSRYNRRSPIESVMFRYKTIIGRRLQVRSLSNRRTEAKMARDVLNRMTTLGMPVSARVPRYAGRQGKHHWRPICAPTPVNVAIPRLGLIVRARPAWQRRKPATSRFQPRPDPLAR